MKTLVSFVRRLLARAGIRIAGLGDPYQERIERLRHRGVRIGEGCMILTDDFSTEPYLVEIGNHVGIAGGTAFLTHDASIWLMRDTRPDIQHFGRISVGDNTYIGLNCIFLPGTRVGKNCIIGAGSVVRGNIPDNSIVVGNPASVIGRASLLIERLKDSPDTFDSLRMRYSERKQMLCRHFEIGG